MRISVASLTAILHLLQLGDSKTIPILVGDDDSDSFKPNRVDADVGDIIEFRFTSNEHSVVQGNTSMGCYPVGEGGFYSGKQRMVIAYYPFTSFDTRLTSAIAGHVSSYSQQHRSDCSLLISRPAMPRGNACFHQRKHCRSRRLPCGCTQVHHQQKPGWAVWWRTSQLQQYCRWWQHIIGSGSRCHFTVSSCNSFSSLCAFSSVGGITSGW